VRKLAGVASLVVLPHVLSWSLSNGAFAIDDEFSWRDHATSQQLAGLKWRLDEYGQMSAWLALIERACGRAVPNQDTQAGFLEPLLERGILRRMEVEEAVPEKKYAAWQNLLSPTKCDRELMDRIPEHRTKLLLQMEAIKLDALQNELARTAKRNADDQSLRRR
jgi:hypothetical protein